MRPRSSSATRRDRSGGRRGSSCRTARRDAPFCQPPGPIPTPRGWSSRPAGRSLPSRCRVLWEADSSEPWLGRATEWCWAKLDGADELGTYGVKFSLRFLDHVPDDARPDAAIQGLRARLGADGSLPVPGGTENERLTRSTYPRSPVRAAANSSPTTRSPRTSTGSNADSRTTAAGHSTGWRGRRDSPARGAAIVMVRALATLHAHARV